MSIIASIRRPRPFNPAYDGAKISEVPLAFSRKLATAAALLVALAGAGRSRSHAAAPSPDGEPNRHLNARVCAGCHMNIYERYGHTGMARAFYAPSPESFPNFRPYFHRPSGTWFQMVAKDGAYYQRVWQIGYSGKQENFSEWKIDYVMGSGNHVRSYLHRTIRNTLIELPLAWYAEKGGYWAMNPGFDNEDPTARRNVGYECMFCHNGYPSIPAGHDDPGAEPVYALPLPDGIDCQRCHGPGGNHVRVAQLPNAKRADLRSTIVNPARLPAARAMEVCMQCHLETTSLPLPNEIRRYDRAPYSYRPGEPLTSFILFYDHAPGRGKDDKFEIVSSVYRLRKSQCFLRSGGALTCTTCHNPHDIPHGPEAADHYNAACRQCHSGSLAGDHPQAGNCIACHMPKRRTEDVVHVVMTDHLIQRRAPANLLADFPKGDRTETDYQGEVVPYGTPDLPADDLYTAVAQVAAKTNLAAGVPRLEAALAERQPASPVFYLQMGDAYCSTNQYAKAVGPYQQAATRQPKSSVVLRRLAYAFLGAGQPQQALDPLLRATAVQPSDAEAWYDLALIQTELGKDTDALSSLAKANQLDPEYAEAQNRLGAVLAKTGQTGLAEGAYRSSLRIQPTLADAHANLADLLAARNDLEEAVWHYQRAGGKPITQFRYGVTLARMNRLAEAQTQIEAALKSNPSLAEGHDVLGGLLEKQGRLDAAEVQYREAVRIRPDLGGAHFDLGRVLAKRRDLPAAAEEFRKAAADPEPAVRQQALQALQAIGAH
jgi:tetratricopeptide (TPR) repeat protein